MGKETGRFIGIDLSKRTYEAVAIDGKTESIQRWNGKLDIRGRRSLAERVRPGDTIAMEAGTSSFQIAKELMEHPDIQVLVLNAADLAVIHKSLKKSDREDALKLARLVQKFNADELPTVPVPSDEEMDRRALSSHEDRFRRDRTRLINRLHAVFLRCGIPDHTKAQLKKAATRERLIETELAGFSKTEAINLHHMISEYEQILAGLVEEIGASVMKGGESAHILMSLPGFGIKTTMAILAYAGDMRRFSGPAQLVNYVGLSPRLHESGELERKGSITKRGNAHLRGLLVQSAWGLIRSKCSNPLKSHYEAMISRGKAPSIAVVATARKLLEMVYILLTRGERYRYTDDMIFALKLKRSGLAILGAGG